MNISNEQLLCQESLVIRDFLGKNVFFSFAIRFFFSLQKIIIMFSVKSGLYDIWLI